MLAGGYQGSRTVDTVDFYDYTTGWFNCLAKLPYPCYGI